MHDWELRSESSHVKTKGEKARKGSSGSLVVGTTLSGESCKKWVGGVGQ